MQAFVLTLFCCVILGSFLALHGFPGAVKYTPEILSATAVLWVVFAGTRQRFRFVAVKYWLVFAGLLILIASGVFVNGTDSGPIIAGSRAYLRAIPVFFVPAVCVFTGKQIRQQLIALTMLALIQLPLAAYQRWMTYLDGTGNMSGDTVAGTVGGSGTLTIWLIGTATVLLGFIIRGHVSRSRAFFLMFLLLVPTMINETKVTIFMLPLALFVSAMAGAPANKRLRIVGLTVVLVVFIGAVFVPVYNAIEANQKYPQTISLDLLTDPDKNYLKAKDAGIGATKYVGRADAINLSVDYVSSEPVRAAFGLGLGNVSVSSLGPSFSGKYLPLFKFVAVTTFAVFLLEIGWFGILLVLLLHLFVFADALFIARVDRDAYGAIAVGITGITAIIILSCIYMAIHTQESVSYLYWYFSGLIAARRMQLAVPPPSTLRTAV